MTSNRHASDRRLIFSPSLHITLLALFATILFLTLGMWQLQRADEKKTREQQASQAEHQLPQALSTTPTAYQRIQIKGQYLKKTLLLDNQHEQHQLGYQVLTPFLLENNTIVIINRGWIPKDIRHITEPPTTLVTLVGHVYYPSSKQWALGEEMEIKSDKLAIIQTLNQKLFNRFLQKSVYPFIIRLDAQEPHGFVRHWIINNMPWQRHIAYAIQWFVFAIIVIILYLVRNIRYEKK